MNDEVANHREEYKEELQDNNFLDVGNAGVLALLNNKQIQYLDLSGNGSIDDEVVPALLSQQHVLSIDLEQTHISKDNRAKISARCTENSRLQNERRNQRPAVIQQTVAEKEEPCVEEEAAASSDASVTKVSTNQDSFFAASSTKAGTPPSLISSSDQVPTLVNEVLNTRPG